MLLSLSELHEADGVLFLSNIEQPCLVVALTLRHVQVSSCSDSRSTSDCDRPVLVATSMLKRCGSPTTASRMIKAPLAQILIASSNYCFPCGPHAAWSLTDLVGQRNIRGHTVGKVFDRLEWTEASAPHVKLFNQRMSPSIHSSDFEKLQSGVSCEALKGSGTDKSYDQKVDDRDRC